MISSSEPSDRPLRRISSWKVFGVFCLVVFLFLLGVLFIPWDVQAPDDSDLHYTPPTLDAGKNAFTGIEAAGKLCVTRFTSPTDPNRDWTKLLYGIGSKSEEWDPAFADEVLATNATAFAELEKGLACERYASPPVKDFSTLLPWLQKYKQLAQLLYLKSKRMQLAGDPVAAAQVALQGLRFGQLITDDANYLIEWLVGIACQNIAMARINEIIADAKTPELALRDLLAQLDRWDPKGIERGYKQAMQEEYRVTKTTLEMLQQGRLGEILGSEAPPSLSRIPYVLKPNMSRQMMVPFFRNQIENADRISSKIRYDYPGKPKEPAGLLAKAGMFLGPNSGGKVLYFMLTPASQGASGKKYLVQANIAGLRLKVALRLYELKHGQLPDDLKALVPEFIKEIPIDSYGGQPFRYSKTEKKVWATGFDLVDNGGKMRDDLEMMDGLKSHKCDVVLRLGTREMKPTSPPPPGSQPKEEPF
jgi:hypothetical protein